MAHAKAKVGFVGRCMSDTTAGACACPALHCMSGCHWCHHVCESAPDLVCKLVFSDSQLLIQFQGIRAFQTQNGPNINANPCLLVGRVRIRFCMVYTSVLMTCSCQDILLGKEGSCFVRPFDPDDKIFLCRYRVWFVGCRLMFLYLVLGPLALIRAPAQSKLAISVLKIDEEPVRYLVGFEHVTPGEAQRLRAQCGEAGQEEDQT